MTSFVVFFNKKPQPTTVIYIYIYIERERERERNRESYGTLENAATLKIH